MTVLIISGHIEQLWYVPSPIFEHPVDILYAYIEVDEGIQRPARLRVERSMQRSAMQNDAVRGSLEIGSGQIESSVIVADAFVEVQRTWCP